MKPDIVLKMQPVLATIRTALVEPVDFICLTVELGSGRQTLRGSVTAADPAASLFDYYLAGRSGRDAAEPVINLLAILAAQYERMVLTLAERGRQRVFSCDDKGVRIVQAGPANGRPVQSRHNQKSAGTASPAGPDLAGRKKLSMPDRPATEPEQPGQDEQSEQAAPGKQAAPNTQAVQNSHARFAAHFLPAHLLSSHDLDSSCLESPHGQVYGTSSKRAYWIRVGEADALLQAIGIEDASGKLRTDKLRKYHQIDRFVELADPVLASLLAAPAAAGQPLNVVDLACGKSYLSFVLNYYIREKLGKACNFSGVDYAAGVIESSNNLAARLGYRNMRFIQADLNLFKTDGPIDLAISLHACDTATDLALAAAIRARSRAIIVVPCCQRELLANQFHLPVLAKSVMTSGILQARLADLLTDSLRLLLLRAAGYEATIIEYVSPLDTPKNLMIRAIDTGRPDRVAWQEYLSLQQTLGTTITLGRLLQDSGLGLRLARSDEH